MIGTAGPPRSARMTSSLFCSGSSMSRISTSMGCLGALTPPAIVRLDSLVSLTIEQLAEHVACRGLVVNDQTTPWFISPTLHAAPSSAG